MNRILLIDLAERELQARAQLKARADCLRTIANTSATSGGLSADQVKELTQLDLKLDSDVTVDEFYRTVASQVARRTWDQLVNGPDPEYVLKYGLFGSQQTSLHADLGVNEREIASVCGLLELDNITDPTNARFVRSIAEAQGEYRQSVDLFNAAYALFKERSVVTVQSQIDQGSLNASIIGSITPDASIAHRVAVTQKQVPGGDEKVNALSARTLAQIVRRLVSDRVTANDTWLSSRLESPF